MAYDSTDEARREFQQAKRNDATRSGKQVSVGQFIPAPQSAERKPILCRDCKSPLSEFFNCEACSESRSKMVTQQREIIRAAKERGRLEVQERHFLRSSGAGATVKALEERFSGDADTKPQKPRARFRGAFGEER